MLDWELTMKCNLDCDYCLTGLYEGHDNSTRHPAAADCLQTIDFMFAYVDEIMKTRIPSMRNVILNVYGGEALHHPNIVQILQQVRARYQKYMEQWHLTVTTTTNAIVSDRILDHIIPLIDEFTVSYHTNNTQEQQRQFRQNILKIQSKGKPVKCVILMHTEPELFKNAQSQIVWCNQHGVRYLPRQLDVKTVVNNQTRYNQQQVQWFEKTYQDRSYNTQVELEPKDNTVLSDQGRACCGGRQLCVDGNHRRRHFFVDNRFPGWYCSVDQFFVYIKQVTREVFVNRDCKMNYQGSNGAIGSLDDTQQILDNLRQGMPTIQCANPQCFCGVCAPKAKDLATYQKIMSKYSL